MFYYIESVGSELCGAMLPQSSVLSCTISTLAPSEMVPGEKKMAHREDGFITVLLPAPLLAAPSRSRPSRWPGGGLCYFRIFRCRTAALHVPPFKVRAAVSLPQKNLICL